MLIQMYFFFHLIRTRFDFVAVIYQKWIIKKRIASINRQSNLLSIWFCNRRTWHRQAPAGYTKTFQTCYFVSMKFTSMNTYFEKLLFCVCVGAIFEHAFQYPADSYLSMLGLVQLSIDIALHFVCTHSKFSWDCKSLFFSFASAIPECCSSGSKQTKTSSMCTQWWQCACKKISKLASQNFEWKSLQKWFLAPKLMALYQLDKLHN